MIPTKRLNLGHRPGVLAHLLRLEPEDRRLRFGSSVPDAVIEAYVAAIDFRQDDVFGVFAVDATLAGVAHLAYGLHGHAEVGVSVDQERRGEGVGHALFQRALVHARNRGVQCLVVHCLADNRVMQHIARDVGMALETEAGEVAGSLPLTQPTPLDFSREIAEEQLGAWDEAVKLAYQRFCLMQHLAAEQKRLWWLPLRGSSAA